MSHITFPLDTIRVDKQITQNTSIKDLIIKRYNKFGIINFYNGLSPVLIRSIPSTILGMLVYENIKKNRIIYLNLIIKMFNIIISCTPFISIYTFRWL